MEIDFLRLAQCLASVFICLSNAIPTPKYSVCAIWFLNPNCIFEGCVKLLMQSTPAPSLGLHVGGIGGILGILKF